MQKFPKLKIVAYFGYILDIPITYICISFHLSLLKMKRIFHLFSSPCHAAFRPLPQPLPPRLAAPLAASLPAALRISQARALGAAGGWRRRGEEMKKVIKNDLK